MESKPLRQLAPALWAVEGQADAQIPNFLRKYDFSFVLGAAARTR
jgi:hypothetical protein